MKQIWEEIDVLRHKILASKSSLAGTISLISKEREQIAKYGRQLNTLVERVELIEQGREKC